MVGRLLITQQEEAWAVDWYGFLWATMLGLAFGSFSGVVLDRVPLGHSVVWQKSHCSTCGLHLRWYDLIPVVSYLWLRGRCRTCDYQIPLRALVIEVLAGVVAGAAWLFLGLPGTVGALALTVCLAWGEALRKRHKLRLGSQEGTSLVEAVVATALLAATVTPVVQFYVQSWKMQFEVQSRLILVNLARAKLDELSGLPKRTGLAAVQQPNWTCVDPNGSDTKEWRWNVVEWDEDGDASTPSRLYRATVEVRWNPCGQTPSAVSPPRLETLWAIIQ